MDHHYHHARTKIHQRKEPAMAVIEGRLSLKEAAASSHRVTGDRRDGVKGIGAEFLHVATDHHSMLAFTAMYPDQTEASASLFLCTATA